MVKKSVLAAVLAFIVTAGAFADWWDSYAPGIDQSFLFVNAGAGFGFNFLWLNIGTIGTVIPEFVLPELSASAEFKLPISAPVTVGAMGMVSSYRNKSGGEQHSITPVSIGLRGSWHFNFAENLDVYAGITGGWTLCDDTVLTLKTNISHKSSLSTPFGGVHIGGRYFFTDNIGAYLEAQAFYPRTIASVGLTLKF